MVKHVLYARADLQAVVFVQMYVVCQAYAQIPERRCHGLLVLCCVPCQVGNKHRAGSLAVDRNSKVVHGLDVQQEIAIVIRRAEHARLRGYVRAPLQRLDVAAVLKGVAC